MNDLQNIQTQWNGETFNTRGEAQFAVFAKQIGLKIFYEKDKVYLKKMRKYYCPDFRVENVTCITKYGTAILNNFAVECKWRFNREYDGTQTCDEAKVLEFAENFPIIVINGLLGWRGYDLCQNAKDKFWEENGSQKIRFYSSAFLHLERFLNIPQGVEFPVFFAVKNDKPILVDVESYEKNADITETKRAYNRAFAYNFESKNKPTWEVCFDAREKNAEKLKNKQIAPTGKADAIARQLLELENAELKQKIEQLERDLKTEQDRYTLACNCVDEFKNVMRATSEFYENIEQNIKALEKLNYDHSIWMQFVKGLANK